MKDVIWAELPDGTDCVVTEGAVAKDVRVEVQVATGVMIGGRTGVSVSIGLITIGDEVLGLVTTIED